MRLAAKLGRKAKVGVDYEPLYVEHGMYYLFGVEGRDLVAASENYHNATNQWMFGLGVFRNIRLDATHLVRLVNFDCGTVMDRTRDGGRNFIYRVAVQWNLLGSVHPALGGAGRLEGFSDSYLMNVLASDFDAWWKKTKEEKAG